MNNLPPVFVSGSAERGAKIDQYLNYLSRGSDLSSEELEAACEIHKLLDLSGTIQLDFMRYEVISNEIAKAKSVEGREASAYTDALDEIEDDVASIFTEIDDAASRLQSRLAVAERVVSDFRAARFARDQVYKFAFGANEALGRIVNTAGLPDIPMVEESPRADRLRIFLGLISEALSQYQQQGGSSESQSPSSLHDRITNTSFASGNRPSNVLVEPSVSPAAKYSAVAYGSAANGRSSD